MPTPRIMKDFASKIAHIKSSLHNLLFLSIIAAAFGWWKLHNGFEAAWVVGLVSLSTYILLWCSILLFTYATFGTSQNTKKSFLISILDFFVDFEPDDEDKGSSFTKWYSSIIISFMILFLIVSPFFGIYVWVYHGS